MTAPGTSPLAELAELAALARLEECDEDVERLLRRLVRRAPELVTHPHRTLATRSDRKVSEVAEALLRRADHEHGTSDLPWTPVRN